MSLLIVEYQPAIAKIQVHHPITSFAKFMIYTITYTLPMVEASFTSVITVKPRRKAIPARLRIHCRALAYKVN